MVACIITFMVVEIVMLLIYQNKTEPTSDGKIVFEFNKAFKTIMLCCVLFFGMVAIFFFIIGFFNHSKNEYIISIFMLVISLLVSIFYLFVRNKKIIYTENTFYVYNMLGKLKQMSVQDIKKAVEIPSDGMELIFQDNQKIKIDTQMINYSKIKEILDKNNIVYTDKNGNNAPKGW